MRVCRSPFVVAGLASLALVASAGCNAIFGLDAPGGDSDVTPQPDADADADHDAMGGDARPDSGPDGPIPDGSPIDGPLPDAPVDAPPDAPSCVIAAGDTDEDGDLLPDRCDLCPWIAAPGVVQADVDNDHVGDACDPRNDVTTPDTLTFFNFSAASPDVVASSVWTLNTTAGQYEFNGQGSALSGTLATLRTFSAQETVTVTAGLRVANDGSAALQTTTYGVAKFQTPSAVVCVTNAFQHSLVIDGPTIKSEPTGGIDTGFLIHSLQINYAPAAACTRQPPVVEVKETEGAGAGTVGVRLTNFSGVIAVPWLAIVSAPN